VTIRTLRWWDIERIMPVERELFGATAWTAEAFWSELAYPSTRWYVVAEDGGELLGYGGIMVTGSEADIQTIAVVPAAQGRGTGHHLLEALLGEAERRGASSVLLEVRADNDAAIGLYRRAGFERISTRRRYYQPGDVDAHIMRLRPLRHRPRTACPDRRRRLPG
jgi:ribosomal-protein-alanine N-acetyltransferase